MLSGFDYIGLATVFFCHDGKENFVMGKRNHSRKDELGRWDIGGGTIEFGEKVEDCLKREIQEEYATDVLEYDFLGYRDVHRVHEGKPTHWIALDFKVLVDPKLVKNNEPHKFDDVKWFSRETIPEENLLHSQLPHFLEKYQDKL
ncbi:MAG: hypothetical protein A2826_01925 [Candidatus Doudnabacteria bacterium RIFCSPHIGHO2_01_FULL_43_23]|uniref:Nudix hydrolase domain-containing protein n=1 Tax=Candidatus Doudnabacteria bacterium RIFCSPHIGHO2_01_FULL_43_23 TaxID=1817822 RepID=A0A1F5NS94_9BACT|nr:MAG: hypothetical protein A2826_01925 [Candidatus Doudnabacteria bacterium RIFCSPHIGHO2_01_FULL_43_23]